uniref:Putative disease resistance gene NBS-LRR family protein n=1 Tax=Rhizophora mucronata TaxID=61149 RepID=A0A2P2MJK2_RHIMU
MFTNLFLSSSLPFTSVVSIIEVVVIYRSSGGLPSL